MTDADQGDKLLFLFDCGRSGADEHRIVLGDGELDRWAWVAVAELPAYLRPRLARRMESALVGGPYLEAGTVPVGFG